MSAHRIAWMLVAALATGAAAAACGEGASGGVGEDVDGGSFGHVLVDASVGQTADDSSTPDVRAPFVLDCDGGIGANAGDAASIYPAPHPALWQVPSRGGPVLASPRFVPIVFAGDDLASDIGAFMKVFAASSMWTRIGADYGIGPATARAPVVVSTQPAAQVAQHDLESWLAAAIDGAEPGLGPADPSAVYVVFYPATTTVTSASGTSCHGFGGFHAEIAHTGGPIIYAVVARCAPSLPGATSLDFVTVTTAHELFEAATDPRIVTAPAYSSGDVEGELGDLCEDRRTLVPSDVGYAVPRLWSNAAAAAGHDPCAPSDGAAWFQTAADVRDDVTVCTLTQCAGMTKGLVVPPGEGRMVDLVALSDAPTEGPWTIDVSSSGSPDQIQIAACATSASNGDRVRLGVYRAPTAAPQDEIVVVGSRLGARSTATRFVVTY